MADPKPNEAGSSGALAGARDSATGIATRGHVEVVGFTGSADDASFPLVTSVGGVAAVVIPLLSYRRLLAASMNREALEARSKAAARRHQDAPAPLASTIERDPEVAAFLRTRFARADTIDAAHRACADRFGRDRTPSVGRIARFRSKMRRGA